MCGAPALSNFNLPRGSQGRLSSYKMHHQMAAAKNMPNSLLLAWLGLFCQPLICNYFIFDLPCGTRHFMNLGWGGKHFEGQDLTNMPLSDI